jgi:hypothetical protein
MNQITAMQLTSMQETDQLIFPEEIQMKILKNGLIRVLLLIEAKA